MRFALSSTLCTAIVLGALVYRGVDDWSTGFVAFWYGTLGAALVFAFIALGLAFGGLRRSSAQRIAMIALSVPAFLVVGLIVLVVVVLIPRLN